MNLEGTDGPILKKIFSCKPCKWLGTSVGVMYVNNRPHKCLHPNYTFNYDKFFDGDIGDDKITPLSCPYLLVKLRKEKLKEIENGDNRISKQSE